MEYSTDQAAALEKIAAWRKRAGRGDAFCLTGLAGTGKTRIAATLEEHLGLSPGFATPTHKSAHVLRSKVPADSKVGTIHSLIYIPEKRAWCRRTNIEVYPKDCKHGPDSWGCDCMQEFTTCGRCTPNCRVRTELRFSRREKLPENSVFDLIVLDEASMITDDIVMDVLSYKLPVLLIGDHGQLPPVKAKMNRWMQHPDATLVKNHRQLEGNGIVEAAYRWREHGDLPLGNYGDGSTVCVSASEHPQVLEVLNADRLPPGPDSAIIVPINRLRAQINRKLHGDDPLPRVGDRVIRLENLRHELKDIMKQDADGNWKHTGTETDKLFNGSTGTVRAVNTMGVHTGTETELIVEIDGTGMLVQDVCATSQFGREKQLEPQERRAKGGGSLWDYAYAMTAHKAQGSEYEKVVVLDTGRIRDKNRWMYTACTRAKDKLVVIRL